MAKKSLQADNFMAKRVLFSWLGITDLKSSGQRLGNDEQTPGNGPILNALLDLDFDEVHLLHNVKKAEAETYHKWLLDKVNPSRLSIAIYPVKLASPIDFGAIYYLANEFLSELTTNQPDIDLALHLSPGTPAMAAVSILLGKTQFNTRFVQSNREEKASFVNLPFDISAEFVPQMIRDADKSLGQLAAAEAPVSAAFSDIITQNLDMKRLIQRAEKIAQRDVPVLIMGESGTGKELFARAIHNASLRQGKPFIPVNCGAIPKDLVDTELFGFIKGAFSGAIKDRAGYFEAANGGTIFLDEFGELPLDMQVRLLRVLESGEISRVGESQTRQVDVRVITATNRQLVNDVAEGHFREDLFYRVAIGVIHLPPLRERTGDMGVLAETLMAQINQKAAIQPGYENKKISVKAKNIILNHSWPGNVRELNGALLRASIWAKSNTISAQDMQEAILARPATPGGATSSILPDASQGVDISDILDNVRRKYLQDALTLTGGSKTKVAELLNLPNYQTVSNWMEKLGIS